MGAHVRDAAAYVCWAFARAYEKEAMAEAARQLAPALLAVACYDREVCPLNSLTSSVTRNNCGKLILLGSIQCFMMVIYTQSMHCCRRVWFPPERDNFDLAPQTCCTCSRSTGFIAE